MTTLVVLALGATSHAQTVLSTDVLVWLDSQLPARQFVGIAKQQRNPDGSWSRASWVYQPFRSRTNREGRQIYWRKDDALDLGHSWYGEIWSFDDTHVRLSSETYPSMFAGDSWDARPDRFRLFHERGSNGRGRVLAPRTYSSDWSYAQVVDTQVCGVSQTSAGYTPVDGWLQASAGQCPSYTNGTVDALVKVEIVRNWSAYEAGMSTDASGTALGPDTAYVSRLPAVWDAAYIISQYMRWNGGYARERFVMGYHQGVYYGIVAWDDSWGPDLSQQSVSSRAVPEAILARQSGDFDFDGMTMRSARSRVLPPASMPANLTARCIDDSAEALLSWDPMPGQTSADIRVDDLADPWQPGVSPADLVLDAHPGNSRIVGTQPGHTYRWWVHGRNAAGVTDPAGAPQVLAACSGTPKQLPAAPGTATVQLVGDVAIVTWEPVRNATGYEIVLRDLSQAQRQPETVVGNFRGTSYIVRMLPGHVYRLWVSARNAAGASRPGPAVDFQYAGASSP